MGYSYFYWMVKLRSLGKVEAICHSKAAAPSLFVLLHAW